MPERVLVIDPGERVGYCVALIQPELGELGFDFQITSHGITDLKTFALKLAEPETLLKYDTVVVETWRLQAGREREFIGSEFLPVQLIGMIRLLIWQDGVTKLVWQSPARKKTGEKFARGHLPHIAELLDRLPKSHDDAHDGDAVLHAVAYYFDTRVKRGGTNGSTEQAG
jgi:hypothetical protein